MLPAEEVGPILAWVNAGAGRNTYEADIRPTGSGLLMGLAFAFMWALSMYELRVFPSSRRVIEATKPAAV